MTFAHHRRDPSRHRPVRRLRPGPHLPRPTRASCTPSPASWSATAATSSRASSSATSSPAGSSCASTSWCPAPATSMISAEELRRDFADVAAAVRHDLRAVGRAGAVPHPDHGLQAPALPQRPAVPLQHRLAADRDPGGGLQPPRRRAAGARPRPRLRAHPGDPGDQAPGRGPAPRAGREARHPPRRAGPLHAGAVRRPVRRAVRPGDQHPPLVPAELQGREALPPGLRPRREAGGCHRALRHRPTSTRARSSSRTSSASTTRSTRTSWSPPAATSRPRCSRAPYAGTPSRGSSSTATAPSSSADGDYPDRLSIRSTVAS